MREPVLAIPIVPPINVTGRLPATTDNSEALAPVAGNLDVSSKTSSATSPWVQCITNSVADKVEGDDKRDEQYAGNEQV